MEGDGAYSFAQFLEHHKSQLNASNVPPELWHCLYVKLTQEKFDAGDKFQIICEEMDEGKRCSVVALEDLHNVDEENIFLIDHLWTFRAHEARAHLEAMPQLLERVAALFEIDGDKSADETPEVVVTSDDAEKKKHEEMVQQASQVGGNLPRHESVDARLSGHGKNTEDDVLIQKVLKELWKHAQTYTVRYKREMDEESLPLWYIMDEFGARIGHSSTSPNVRVVPLYYLPQQCAYNVMYLTKPVESGEEITRDFADNTLSLQHADWKPYLELPWNYQDFSGELNVCPPPSDDFFSSGRIADVVPSSSEQNISLSAIAASLPTTKKRVLRIFADDTQLIKFITKYEFELVDDWKKADIVWLMKHFHQYEEFCTENPCGLINQFPYESCLNVKDLMAAITMQENNGKGTSWYQTTYNLNTELPQFVAKFQQNTKAANVPNVWIVKPWNLARGMDMHVTDDLNKIIRLVETGPKIVCEYIARPLLFPRPDNGNRVKFDLRYIVFVNSLRPVTAYVYNKFWIRFGINEFSLSHLDDVETHFTVFNYTADSSKVLQMQCEKFVETIEATYTDLKWAQIEKSIYSAIRGALEVASKNDAPRGVAPNVQSRAMYGVDVMLQYDENDTIVPTLLEVNFMPDCTRACHYYPDFADTVVDTMFFDEIDPSKVTAI